MGSVLVISLFIFPLDFFIWLRISDVNENRCPYYYRKEATFPGLPKSSEVI